MHKCEKCGKEFSGNFCPECGTKAEVPAVCPHCGAVLKPDANFCPQCGKPVAAAQTSDPVQQSESGIKNETKRDLEFNVRMYENMAGKRSMLIFLISSIILILLGVTVFTCEYLLGNGEKHVSYPAFFCIVCGAVFFVFVFIRKPLMRRTIQKNMQGKDSMNVYTFAETEYKVVTKLSDGTESMASGNYFGFTEAKEFKDMWILYINKATVFPVAKEGMTEGAAEELSALFSRVMAGRYKVCYKK